MCPSSMTFFHFWYSDLVKAAPSGSVVPRGVKPKVANEALSCSSLSAFAIPLFSLASTSGGTVAGV